MNLQGILSKLDNPTLGTALGFAMTELHDDQATGRPMGGTLMLQIQNLMTQPHFPNISHVIADLMSDGYSGAVFKPAIMAGIAGWVLDEVDIPFVPKSLGKVLQTLGFNGAIGAAAASLLEMSTTSHSPSPAGTPYGGHNGYPAGAGYSPLGRRNGGYFTMPNVPPQTPTLPSVLPRSPRPN